MKTKGTLAVGVGLLVLSLAKTAAADIDFFHVFRVQRFHQTTAVASATPISWDCEARIDASDKTTFTTGTVTFTGPDSPAPLTFLGVVSAPNGTPEQAYQWSSASFASQADLDAHCPAGDYLFAVSGGTLGSTSATMTAAASAYTPSIPAVDGPSFNALQAYDPSQTLTLSAVTHTAVANTTFMGTYLDIVDPASNATVASSFAPGTTALSLQVDAGTLQPAKSYQVQVFFTDRFEVPNAGFGAATADSAFDRASVLDFATLGPADAGRPSDEAGAPDAAPQAGPDGGFPAPAPNAAQPAPKSDSCSCDVVMANADGAGAVLAGLAIAIAFARRRRRRI